MIPINKPYLPSRSDYEPYLKGIWKRNWLTNNGPLVNDLELRLKDYLEVDHFLFVTSGTIALQLAIKALEITGEVITTPFSYIATTSSIVWEGLTPVFCDIHKDTFNIDPSKIESCITEKTSAIIATHVYGNPCNIDLIDKIASKHGLKVIYDGAHAFGVQYKGKSVFEYGDMSITSFHATKLFHTIEGGGVFTRSAKLLKKVSFQRNFGHHGPDNFAEVGINGKNSEFHAAMGLCNLKYIDSILEKRKSDYLYYQKVLSSINVQYQIIDDNSVYNYSYFPVMFASSEIALKVLKNLEDNEIYPRRYFYPTLDSASYLAKSDSIPVADEVASKILCLPFFFDISKEEIDMVCRIIKRTLNY